MALSGIVVTLLFGGIGVLLTILLWLAIGTRLNNRLAREAIVGLSLFFGVTFLATVAPLGYTGFVPIGLLTWLFFGLWLRSEKTDLSPANRRPGELE